MPLVHATRKSYTVKVYWRRPYRKNTELESEVRREELASINAELEKKVSQQYVEWDIVSIKVLKAVYEDDLADTIVYTLKVAVLLYKD
jgi:hypothetical protein